MKLNIIRKSNDPYARYTMPQLTISSIGKKANSRTILTNLKDIAASLKRPPVLILKYIGYEKGTSTELKHDSYQLRGIYDLEDLQNMIYEYIELYVLCRDCGNPETYYLRERGVVMRCYACGADFRLGKDRMCNLIEKELERCGSMENKSYAGDNMEDEEPEANNLIVNKTDENTNNETIIDSKMNVENVKDINKNKEGFNKKECLNNQNTNNQNVNNQNVNLIDNKKNNENIMKKENHTKGNVELENITGKINSNNDNLNKNNQDNNHKENILEDILRSKNENLKKTEEDVYSFYKSNNLQPENIFKQALEILKDDFLTIIVFKRIVKDDERNLSIFLSCLECKLVEEKKTEEIGNILEALVQNGVCKKLECFRFFKGKSKQLNKEDSAKIRKETSRYFG